jgi:phosphomannomutase
VADLSNIVKAYDVRGVVPDQLNADIARALGAAFARFTGAGQIVTARDMRDSGIALSEAFAEGATSQGADVVDAGLGSTDLLYFAAGKLEVPGAMFTASHNPAKYNGIKLCLAGAKPVGQDTGLAQLRADAEKYLDEGLPSYDGKPGSVTTHEMLAEYAAYMKELVPDLAGMRPLKVVVDAGNGMGGLTVPVTFEGLPLDTTDLYFELDGSFPNHEANPIEPANLVDLQAKVREVGADLGLAFDGDADRCFVVDADGEPVSASAITGLVAAREIERARAAGDTDIRVVHNVISSRAVAENIREHDAEPVRARVGHSFMKADMARTGAVFGGEHSAHYYFRDFWYADTGMLAALHVLAALGERDESLSRLVASYERYASSGEINSTVPEPGAVLDRIRAWAAARGCGTDELDGLTVLAPAAADAPERGSSVAGDWWFNVRTSNTEPLLRLNVEATERETMVGVRDEVLGLIRGGTRA